MFFAIKCFVFHSHMWPGRAFQKVFFVMPVKTFPIREKIVHEKCFPATIVFPGNFLCFCSDGKVLTEQLHEDTIPFRNNNHIENFRLTIVYFSHYNIISKSIKISHCITNCEFSFRIMRTKRFYFNINYTSIKCNCRMEFNCMTSLNGWAGNGIVSSKHPIPISPRKERSA